MNLISKCYRAALVGLGIGMGTSPAIADTPPRVQLKTSMGDIVIALYPDKSPKTVANFLQYVNDSFYAGTIFHRVIDGFMIQGGGFTADFALKPTHAAIENEAGNGVKNTRGTLAMARTGDPHSATAQFFINVADNASLDHTAPTQSGFGYCVFGEVVEGIDVVDQIRKVPTKSRGPHQDVPVTPIVIESATALTNEPAAAKGPPATQAP
ncbi:MAG: peptidyl-prolyl cis-trans isomerase [Gammaproteobacteria bacterium]|nr:peptidyl-prolyl cis-trans isomerase [Gammaproteobacteria bacterium]